MRDANLVLRLFPFTFFSLPCCMSITKKASKMGSPHQIPPKMAPSQRRSRGTSCCSATKTGVETRRFRGRGVKRLRASSSGLSSPFGSAFMVGQGSRAPSGVRDLTAASGILLRRVAESTPGAGTQLNSGLRT